MLLISWFLVASISIWPNFINQSYPINCQYMLYIQGCWWWWRWRRLYPRHSSILHRWGAWFPNVSLVSAHPGIRALLSFRGWCVFDYTDTFLCTSRPPFLLISTTNTQSPTSTLSHRHHVITSSLQPPPYQHHQRHYLHMTPINRIWEKFISQWPYNRPRLQSIVHRDGGRHAHMGQILFLDLSASVGMS